MEKFTITVSGEDITDLDFIRERCVTAVEEVVEESKGRFDAEVVVDWEWGDAE
jgi:hypothetical protein